MSFGLFVHDLNIGGKLYDGSTADLENALASKKYVNDAISQGGGDWLASVLSEVDAAPGSPSVGDRHLVGSSPSGWGTGLPHNDLDATPVNISAGDVVERAVDPANSAQQVYLIYSPSAGTHVFDENTGNALIYTSAGAWVVAANATGALVAANSLSEIASAGTQATARGNLGLGSIATQDAATVAITGGSISGITDLAIADGGTGASDAAGARTNLGLGSVATQDASAVAITGGSIAGITDLAIADGGTGASNVTDARANLGLGTAALLDQGVSKLNLVHAASTLTAGSVVQLANVEEVTLNFVNPGSNFVYINVGSAWTGPNNTEGAVLAKNVEYSVVFNNPGANWNSISAGDAWSNGPNHFGSPTNGTVVSVTGASNAANATLVISMASGQNFAAAFSTSGGDSITIGGNTFTTASASESSSLVVDFSVSGAFFNLNAGGTDTINSSGYSFTTSSASSSTTTGLNSLSDSKLREKVGIASTGLLNNQPTRGIASFDSEFFTVTSGTSYDGFVSINAGVASGDLMQLSGAVPTGELVKCESLPTISGSFASQTSPGSAVAVTTTNVTSAVAGQAVTTNNGYSFTLASAPVVDPNNASQYLMTMTASLNLNYATTGGTTFTIVGGDGFISAGAAGTAANVDIATASGASADDKVLKVASGASLSTGSLLAIDASGNIVAGSSSNLSGPTIKNTDGQLTSITMPATVGGLKGIYAVADAAAGANKTATLPKSFSSSDLGTTVTFKAHGLNGNSLVVSGPVLTGGGQMTIDGQPSITIPENASLTCVLTAVAGSDADATDTLAWSII